MKRSTFDLSSSATKIGSGGKSPNNHRFPIRTRRCLMLAAVVAGAAAVLITVIVASVLVTNHKKQRTGAGGTKSTITNTTSIQNSKERLVEEEKNGGGKTITTDSTTSNSSSSSLLTEFSRQMDCIQAEKKGFDQDELLWPLNSGPIINECQRTFSSSSSGAIQTFDDERDFNNQWNKVANSNDDYSSSNSSFLVLNDENEIAAKGHYYGIRPIHYNLSVNVFDEGRRFNGTVHILFRLLERTNRVILDVDTDALQLFAGGGIAVRRFCADEARIRRPVVDLCVRRFVQLRKRQTLIVETNAPMEKGERYVLSIRNFRGQPLSAAAVGAAADDIAASEAHDYDPAASGGSSADQLRGRSRKPSYAGSVGLRLAEDDQQQSPGGWALTTIFQMRYARTVFPCIDHPLMKARFTVTVQRPGDALAASNTPLDYTESTGTTGTNRDHFQTTPPLPPYVVTFSVMKGYVLFASSENNQTNNANVTTRIELYYPDLIGQLRGQNNVKGDPAYTWIIDETRQVMGEMRRSTGLAYSLPKLGFINVNPAPFWGIENYGLVTLESGFSRYPDIERGHTILVHEIVHQWLGDVITISRWDEICLQEGLTAYFEWKLSEQLPSVQITAQLQAKRARAENMRKDELNGAPLIRGYNKTDDIAEVCFGKPPLIFHMIADAYGSNVWELFLTRLLAERAYGNADFETWISTISAITGTPKTGRFLRQWFTQPGHPILYVQIDPSDPVLINITQGLILNGEILTSPPEQQQAEPRLVPVKILTPQIAASGLSSAEAVFVDGADHVTRLPARGPGPASAAPQQGWVLVDPDGVTFTRKVYTVSNYRSLLRCLPPANSGDDDPSTIMTRATTGGTGSCQGASRERIHEAFDDFCFALLKNAFPWGPDRKIGAAAGAGVGVSRSTSGSVVVDTAAWSGLFDQLHDATTMASGQRSLQVDRACECCFRTKEELDREAAMSAWHPLACKRLWNEMCRDLDVLRAIGRNYTAPDQERIDSNNNQRG